MIGSRKELDEHAALVPKFPKMENDEPTWPLSHLALAERPYLTFNRSGDFQFDRLIVGQYQEGMSGKRKISGQRTLLDGRCSRCSW